MLVVSCPECKQRYALPEEASGTIKQCRKCDCEIRVPLSWRESDFHALRTLQGSKSPSGGKLELNPVKGSARKPTNRAVWRLLAIVTATAAVFVLAFLLIRRARNPLDFAETVRGNVHRQLAFDCPTNYELIYRCKQFHDGEVVSSNITHSFHSNGKFVVEERPDYDPNDVSYRGCDGESKWSKDVSGRVRVSDAKKPATRKSRDWDELHFVRRGGWSHPDAAVSLRYLADESSADEIALAIEFDNSRFSGTARIARATWLPRSFTMSRRGRIHATHFKDYRETAIGMLPGLTELVINGQLDGAWNLQNASVIKPLAASRFSIPEETFEMEINPRISPKLKVKQDKWGKLYVKPRINGSSPGWMLFDTGAFSSFVDRTTAAITNLSATDGGLSTGVGGTYSKYANCKMDYFVLGPLRIRHHRMRVQDDAFHSSSFNEPVCGILGCDIIRSAIFVYNKADAQISIHDPRTYVLPSECWESATIDHSPHVETKIAGVLEPQVILLDTGASSFFIGIETPAGKQLAAKTGRPGIARGLGGYSGTIETRLHWIEFANRRFYDVPLTLGLNSQDPFDEYSPGLIGTELMSEFTIVFDLERERLGFINRPGGSFDRN